MPEAGTVDLETGDEIKESKKRAIGNKAARKGKPKLSEIKDSTMAMAQSVDKIQKALSKSKQAKHTAEKRSLDLQQKKLDWEMLKELMKHDESTPAERAERRSVLRKRLLSGLTGSPVSKRSAETESTSRPSDKDSTFMMMKSFPKLKTVDLCLRP